MEPISIEDLALLEVLKRIDSGELNASDSQVMPRLLDDGLVTEAPHGAALTLAGIELCKSLQHRVAADSQAAKILLERGANGHASDATNGEATAEA
jgi:hypothetical protein